MIESIERPGLGPAEQRARPGTGASGAGDFERILRQQQVQRQSRQVQAQTGKDVAPVTFSRHALQRLAQRHIELGPEQSQRLQRAVQSAADKGARNSLVFMDGTAFIVNVSDRTVVTAMAVQATTRGTENNGTVFTNIDSAVLA